MDITWDEDRRRSNRAKHGFDFADAEAVFADATFTFEDDRFNYGEERFITLGLLRGRVVVIAHIERQGSVRAISMRKANKYEQRLYFRSFAD